MSLLLLVGADVVKGALAQQTGGSNWLPPPVVFSFGWVAYSFSGILAAVGDKTFLPSPEFPAVVMSTEWGYHRVNNSWIISRLLRDYEELWMPMEVKERLNKILAEAGNRRRVGLCVSVFEASPDAIAGVPARDTLWYSGYAVAALQLVIAAVPWAAYGIWEEFTVTALGTALAFFTANLPHWTHERWACNRNSRKTFVLTRGNGAQHAIVVIGAGRSLDLEDLATSSEGLPSQTITPIIYAVLTVLWRLQQHSQFLSRLKTDEAALGWICLLNTWPPCFVVGTMTAEDVELDLSAATERQHEGELEVLLAMVSPRRHWRILSLMVCELQTLSKPKESDVLGEPEDNSGYMGTVASCINVWIAIGKRYLFFYPIAVFIAKIRMMAINTGVQYGDFYPFVATTAKNTVLD
ncbi:hypothetical protein SCAR479_07989 [Seiridium cardinale]|uniref:Uncharacterized protein n=1 Tax=Seiridium cardinale TaxID=138064 RepID=A0ABR2XNE1_9PEZI